jgi:YfiH family protein
MSDALLIPDWPAVPGIRATVTTRHLAGRSQAPFDACNLGNRCGDEAFAVEANRASLKQRLDLPEQPYWLRQVHGTSVANGDDFAMSGDDRVAFASDEPEADAAVARSPGVVLAVLTADCLPVFFCAADGTEVAIAHAGWRGLAAGVIEATLDRMSTPSADVLAWLGPAIGAVSYEIGEEVRAAFVDRDAADASAFTPTRPGHWRCDLYALARRRLETAGVRRIYGGGFDTFTDPRFYSYRRAARTGRFASLIWRV